MFAYFKIPPLTNCEHYTKFSEKKCEASLKEASEIACEENLDIRKKLISNTLLFSEKFREFARISTEINFMFDRNR